MTDKSNMAQMGINLNHANGYSLFELILVVVIIGILAAGGIRYYLAVQEEALLTGLDSQARVFAGAIHGARADWLLQQRPANVPTEPGQKLSVNLDGSIIFVNEMGWPANSSTELDSSIDSQTAAECYELWFGLMANPMPVTVQGSENLTGERGQHSYHISARSGVCRYELVSQLLDDEYFFEYNLANGRILTNRSAVD
jgi:MSHA pilin protein MshB